MKGQKLFVRPIEGRDSDSIAAFMDIHAPGSPVPARGLLGKLVGDLVAVVALDLDDPSSVRITSLVVAEPLRRKRIGRLVVKEAETFAANLDRTRLVVARGEADAWFARLGFTESGNELVRRVG
jgi:GNAT superfamily N-acetyltransferase